MNKYGRGNRKKLHSEIFIQIQKFIEEISDMQLYLIEHTNVQKMVLFKKYSNSNNNENDDNSHNNLK